MRYIRTKDGKILENNTRFSYKTLNEVSSGLIEILKQADTIEELCDEFVITEHGLDDDFVIKDFEDVKKYFSKNAKVFGAIRINTRLIYVAKLNDKGELELL